MATRVRVVALKQVRPCDRKPNARLVSRTLVASSRVQLDPDLSQMVMQWGQVSEDWSVRGHVTRCSPLIGPQFLDHDLDHSMEAVSRETFRTGLTCGASCAAEPPCLPIALPEDDPRRRGGGECMEFTRSSAGCGSGATSVFFSSLLQREQVNRLTSFIDASQVIAF